MGSAAPIVFVCVCVIGFFCFSGVCFAYTLFVPFTSLLLSSSLSCSCIISFIKLDTHALQLQLQLHIGEHFYLDVLSLHIYYSFLAMVLE